MNSTAAKAMTEAVKELKKFKDEVFQDGDCYLSIKKVEHYLGLQWGLLEPSEAVTGLCDLLEMCPYQQDVLKSKILQRIRTVDLNAAGEDAVEGSLVPELETIALMGDMTLPRTWQEMVILKKKIKKIDRKLWPSAVLMNEKGVPDWDDLFIGEKCDTFEDKLRKIFPRGCIVSRRDKEDSEENRFAAILKRNEHVLLFVWHEYDVCDDLYDDFNEEFKGEAQKLFAEYENIVQWERLDGCAVLVSIKEASKQPVKKRKVTTETNKEDKSAIKEEENGDIPKVGEVWFAPVDRRYATITKIEPNYQFDSEDEDETTPYGLVRYSYNDDLIPTYGNMPLGGPEDLTRFKDCFTKTNKVSEEAQRIEKR